MAGAEGSAALLRASSIGWSSSKDSMPAGAAGAGTGAE
jgi:hypothetical protein